MVIKLNDDEYYKLGELIEIFDGCYVDNKEVTCFSNIKQYIDNETDINFICESERENILKQLYESKDWLESLNVSIVMVDKLLQYFILVWIDLDIWYFQLYNNEFIISNPLQKNGCSIWNEELQLSCL